MEIYYLAEPKRKKDSRDAGNKARNDVEKICQQNQLLPVFPYNVDTNRQNKLKLWFELHQALHKVPKDKLLLIQYHLPLGYTLFLPGILKKYRVILLLHDLLDLRSGLDTTKEISLINQAHFIISHNQKMSDLLITNGVAKQKLFNLELFDYLRKDDSYQFNHPNDPYCLCFAGNLRKSQFIYHFAPEVAQLGVNLYGNNFDQTKKLPPKVVYHGAFPTEEIQEQLNGRFGLLWDGPSPLSCQGKDGNYLKYNNPHKVSMYLSAEMPVIVWSGAAIADFVQKKHVGLALDSLNDLPDIISRLTPKDYQTLCQNAAKVGQKAAQGGFLTSQLKAIVKQVQA